MSLSDITTLKELSATIHQDNMEKGFWKDWYNDNPHAESVTIPRKRFQQLLIEEKILLEVTEIAEMVEALRHGNPPDEHLPHRDSLSVEAADLQIRHCDLMRIIVSDPDEVVREKLAYNRTRPHRHGKEF